MMQLNIGHVTGSYQRFLDVMLINPEQEIFNVVYMNPLDLDEREETALIKIGTEVLVLTNEYNVSYAIGTTSQSTKLLKEMVSRLENEEVRIKAKNIMLTGYGDSDIAMLIHSKATKYEIINSANQNLIDVLIEMCTAIALHSPSTALAVSASAKLAVFKAGTKAVPTKKEPNPHG